jgi:hypothetical protein
MAKSRQETERVEAGTESRSGTPLRWSVALHLAVISLSGIGVGTLQAHAADLAIPASPTALTLFGAGVVGAVIGLIARLILRSWNGVLRFLLSLAALLAWIVMVDATYIVWVGIHPLAYLSEIEPWIKVGQLAIGCLSIVAASRVGRRAHRPTPLARVYGLIGRTPVEEARASLHWNLMLGLGIALLLGVGTGTLQAYADRIASPVPPLAVALVGAGIMGLLAGLTAICTLQGWTEMVKMLVALLMLLAWMIATEITYADWTGLRQLEYLETADNWAELGQLAIGCMGAIVSGLGRRAIPVEMGPSLHPRQEPAHRSKKRPSTSSRKARDKKERRHRAPALPKPGLSILARRPAPAEENGVKVISATEERCPYCLDVVEKKDPRGIVVCEICGSPHHADCWEAGGGKCQVPHLIT